MPETRSMTSKMAKEFETLTVESTKLKEQIEQSKEKELTEEVAVCENILNSRKNLNCVRKSNV